MRNDSHSIGTALVRETISLARDGRAELLQVTYEPELDGFYRGCGFRPTQAGHTGLTVTLTNKGGPRHTADGGDLRGGARQPVRQGTATRTGLALTA